MRVSIYDGDNPLYEEDCPPARLADGTDAVVWRGLAYPLLEGGRIDVSGRAEAPAAAPILAARQAVDAQAFAFVDGDDTAYLLLRGSVLDREAAAAALRRAGRSVVRSGRYLGEPPEGFEPDWFVRFEKRGKDLADLPAALGGVLGVAATDAAAPEHGDLRVRLLTAELAETRARAATLAAQVARLELRRAEAEAAARSASAGTAQAVAAATVVLQESLEDERRLRAEAEARSLETSARPAPPTTSAQKRASTEFETAVTVLLPRVRLLRDSATVAALEYRDRAALYRELRGIGNATEGPPAGWKKLQAAGGWWERHVGNGDSDAGRLYARYNGAEKVFDLLISKKGDQPRDLQWLTAR